MRGTVPVLLSILLIMAELMTIPAPAAVAAAAGKIDYRPLRSDLQDYLACQQGVYGLYVMDLNSGAVMGINEGEVFHAASTFKVPATLYVYRRVAGGTLEPHQRLVMRSSHLEGGTGHLQFKPLGTAKTVDELVRYAIVYSDNVATNMLLDLVGKDAVKDYMSALGGTVVDLENTTCPRDMALYMREVVRFAGENPWGAKLLLHLRSTVFTDRIPHPLPGEVPVANKIGNWPLTGTYNDVAYVEHPARPYILAVFSRETTGYDDAVRVIREVSRRVYDYQGSPALGVEVVLNGQILSLADEPLAWRGVTLVPLRSLAGAVPEITVDWDQAKGEVHLRSALSGKETEAVIGAAGELVFFEGRSYLPLRELCRLLGLDLAWDGNNKRAVITAGTPQ